LLQQDLHLDGKQDVHGPQYDNIYHKVPLSSHAGKSRASWVHSTVAACSCTPYPGCSCWLLHPDVVMFAAESQAPAISAFSCIPILGYSEWQL